MGRARRNGTEGFPSKRSHRVAIHTSELESCWVLQRGTNFVPCTGSLPAHLGCCMAWGQGEVGWQEQIPVLILSSTRKVFGKQAFTWKLGHACLWKHDAQQPKDRSSPSVRTWAHGPMDARAPGRMGLQTHGHRGARARGSRTRALSDAREYRRTAG